MVLSLLVMRVVKLLSFVAVRLSKILLPVILLNPGFFLVALELAPGAALSLGSFKLPFMSVTVWSPALLLSLPLVTLVRISGLVVRVLPWNETLTSSTTHFMFALSHRA